METKKDIKRVGLSAELISDAVVEMQHLLLKKSKSDDATLEDLRGLASDLMGNVRDITQLAMFILSKAEKIERERKIASLKEGE